MKLKDKINLIKEELTAEIDPIDHKQILASAHIAPRTAVPRKNIFFKMRLQAIIAIFLLVGIIIPIAMIQSNDISKDQDDSEAQPIYSSTDELYGFIATSAVALIHTTNDIFKSNEINVSPNNSLVFLEELNGLNRFLLPIQMMLTYKKAQIYRVASDKPLYQNKINYQGFDLLGNDIIYQIYFNETLKTSTSLTINCLVVLLDKTYKLYGEKHINGDDTLINMTYYIEEGHTTNYVQVSKNLNQVEDSFYYSVVRDNIKILNNKLTINQRDIPYITLENMLLGNRSIKFNVFSSTTNKFLVDYSISDTSLNTGESDDNQESKEKDSGNIIIDIVDDNFKYYVYSDSFHDVYYFENANK